MQSEAIATNSEAPIASVAQISEAHPGAHARQKGARVNVPLNLRLMSPPGFRVSEAVRPVRLMRDDSGSFRPWPGIAGRPGRAPARDECGWPAGHLR